MFQHGTILGNCVAISTEPFPFELSFFLQELRIHIQNIEKKYGSINPALGKVVMNGHGLKEEIKNMFPGAFKKVKTTAKGSNGGSSSDDSQVVFDNSDDNESMVQGDDDNHDETFNQSQNKKRNDTTSREDNDSDDELVIDENKTETSVHDSLLDSTTKDAEAEEEPKGDETEDESDKETQTNDQHNEKSDNSAVETENKHDTEPESECETDRDESEVNRKRKQSKSDADAIPKKRNRLNSQPLDADETDDEIDDESDVSISHPNQVSKPTSEINGSAKVTMRDSSSKETRTATLKHEISTLEDKKTIAIDTLAELKLAKYRCKENIDRYNEEIRILKQRVAIIEHEPACYVCNVSISGRKYFCSDECENNRSERGQ